MVRNWWHFIERVVRGTSVRTDNHSVLVVVIGQGEFHDLRCTCLTRWFESGLSEYDVMKLAVHSDFGTTHSFYLAVRRDLLDLARQASEVTMSRDFGTHPYLWAK
jgi:hypothetical protein